MSDSIVVLPKSADEDLADKIVAALGTANLIPSQKLEKVKSGLCNGSLTGADWKLLVELSEPATSTGGAK